MEVWKIIFLSKWVICRFQPLIFQGVADRTNSVYHLERIDGCPTPMWSYHSPRKIHQNWQNGVAPSTFTTIGVAAKFNITPRKMVAKEDDPASYWEGNFSLDISP